MDDFLLVRQAMYVQKDLYVVTFEAYYKCWLSRIEIAGCFVTVCVCTLLVLVVGMCGKMLRISVLTSTVYVLSLPAALQRNRSWWSGIEFEIFEDVIKVENRDQNWLSDILALRKDGVNYAVSHSEW